MSATVTAMETCHVRVVGAEEFIAAVRSLGLEGDRGTSVPRLDVGLSQSELAQAVGAHRSTVAQELRTLREEGILTTSRNRIGISDVAGLRKRAEQSE